MTLVPFRRKAFCGFLSPLKISLPSAGFETGNFESNNKHADSYTTEYDMLYKNKIFPLQIESSFCLLHENRLINSHYMEVYNKQPHSERHSTSRKKNIPAA
jgi:hypothetical protein